MFLIKSSKLKTKSDNMTKNKTVKQLTKLKY